MGPRKKKHCDMPCRHCCKEMERNFASCYASALVCGDMKTTVSNIESQLRPCLTRWCDDCKNVVLVDSSHEHFRCFSAFVAHKLVQSRNVCGDMKDI